MATIYVYTSAQKSGFDQVEEWVRGMRVGGLLGSRDDNLVRGLRPKVTEVDNTGSNCVVMITKLTQMDMFKKKNKTPWAAISWPIKLTLTSTSPQKLMVS